MNIASIEYSIFPPVMFLLYWRESVDSGKCIRYKVVENQFLLDKLPIRRSVDCSAARLAGQISNKHNNNAYTQRC